MRGNAGECQGNIREWVQYARGMQGNAKGMYRSGYKVPGECRGMPGERIGVGTKCQENARECRGMQENARATYGSRCKVPGECRGIPGKSEGVGAKCTGNAGE